MLLAVLAAMAVISFAGITGAAIANPAGFGKTFDELEKLTVKEGRRPIVGNLFTDEVQRDRNATNRSARRRLFRGK